MERNQRGLEIRVHWNMATAALTLGRPVFQRDHIADFSLGIGDHRPSDSRDLLCPQPGLQREQEHDPIAERITPGIEFGENRANLLVADDLCLLAKCHRTSVEIDTVLFQWADYIIS